MVRVKFRYLVVNFLYPEPPSKSRTALPDLMQIHSPTPDAFNAGALVRLVRDAVDELYGDYGSGMVSSSLKGTLHSHPALGPGLGFVTKLPKADVPVVCRVLRVSGTIRKAEEEVIRRSQNIVKRAQAWEGRATDPMLSSVEKSVEKERRRGDVLAVVDQGGESDEMSE